MAATAPSARVRPSPFYEKTVEDGVASFTCYNHMLMPTGYGQPEVEYDRLINGVAMWDVSVERQVELRGPDAGALAQALCPRKLDDMPTGMGWYVALCDHHGVLLNDPILLKLAEDRYWLSIADSDVKWWAGAIAGERGLDVEVFEPDVSPLAIQGPKAEDVVAALYGDWIREIRYFEVREANIGDIPTMVARSGWSKQGGFELYLTEGSKGGALWDAVKEAGAPFGIGPGNPNPAERIESGLLSWGTDTDAETNPFEVRMGRFVDLDAPDDCVSIAALRRIKEAGVKRRQVGLKIDGDAPLPPVIRQTPIVAEGAGTSVLTASAWSWRMGANIGIALLDKAVPQGARVEVEIGGQMRGAEVCKLPFL